VAVREAIWQLRAIASETRRRWLQLVADSKPIADATHEWLASVEKMNRK
jgi:hypothetical protein